MNKDRARRRLAVQAQIALMQQTTRDPSSGLVETNCVDLLTLMIDAQAAVVRNDAPMGDRQGRTLTLLTITSQPIASPQVATLLNAWAAAADEWLHDDHKRNAAGDGA